MSLADDLLRQSKTLLVLDKLKPKQASLRRAVSTAYYAVFRLLLHDAADRMCPGDPASLPSQFARAFQHGDMKQVCLAVKNGSSSYALQKLSPAGFSPDLRAVAANFIRLQEERHRADYDTGFRYSRQEVAALVLQADELFVLWHQVRNSQEANVFCAALLLGTRWAK